VTTTSVTTPTETRALGTTSTTPTVTPPVTTPKATETKPADVVAALTRYERFKEFVANNKSYVIGGSVAAFAVVGLSLTVYFADMYNTDDEELETAAV
jgi:hypothetical protein